MVESLYFGEVTRFANEWWFVIQIRKEQVYWERKCKNCFHTSSKVIDLRQTKTEMITGPFYTYRQMHFTEKIRFCDNICLKLSGRFTCHSNHLAMFSSLVVDNFT